MRELSAWLVTNPNKIHLKNNPHKAAVDMTLNDRQS